MSHNCSVIKGGCTNRSNIKGKLTVSSVIEDNTQTYILVDEAGNEIPAVLVDEEVVLTATTNDIRLGAVAVTEAGVVTGEKFIPSYYVREGTRLVPNNSKLVIYLSNGSHDYTKLQAIICLFNSNMSNSVAADKVVINDNVFPVQSTVSESVITVGDPDVVDFGIVNTTGRPCLIRYFTYKEVY